MFKERTKPTTTVKTIGSLAPQVAIMQLALDKMKLYVDECSDEIGWMGTARRENNFILIDDVFLFAQEVHSTTTEITPDGLSEFATDLLEMGDAGMDIWNNLKMWGHSHVNMGITPSHQDDKQMETFKEGGHDWFIRLIANKKGELKLDLYDYQNGIIFTDLPWVAVQADAENELQKQIDVLYAQMDALALEREQALKTGIVAEMKMKVTKLVYRSTAYTAPKTQQTALNVGKSATPSTTSQSKKQTTSSGTTTSKGNNKATGKKAGKRGGAKNKEESGFSKGVDYFRDDQQVTETFTSVELMNLAECDRFDELEVALADYGYDGWFTSNDLEKIYRVMKKTAWRASASYNYEEEGSYRHGNTTRY